MIKRKNIIKIAIDSPAAAGAGTVAKAISNHYLVRMNIIVAILSTIPHKREDGTMNEKRRSNDWYVKANKMCEQNYTNLFNPNYKPFTWEDVWK